MESTVIGDFRCLYQKKNANRETCAAIIYRNIRLRVSRKTRYCNIS